MRNTLVVFLLFITVASKAQSHYWQQYLHYSIDVKLNDQEKSISGSEKIVYKNNSPEALTYIWFHIYPNAYKDKTTAFSQQILNDAVRKNQLKKKFLGGFISGLKFKVNGTDAKTEPHPQYKDVIKLVLPQPLRSGDSVIISTPFTVKLPLYFSRSGYNKTEFMICQWYPKPAVVDKNGWHEMPYLDVGEFYSEYASYNVKITIPKSYVVGATGILCDSSESNIYKTLGIYNNTNRNKKPRMYQPSSDTGYKTLLYHADSVPDFAWFADKKFVIAYDTMKLKSGCVIDVFTFYHSGVWTKGIDFIKDAVKHYSHWIGEYGYPSVQAVEAPGNGWGGDGMEYPTITLISMPHADSRTLDEVITHEVGHNWFMAMLGTNQRNFAWMDEGLNTYFEYRYMAEKYRTNDYFTPDQNPKLKYLDEKNFLASVYRGLLLAPIYPAISTPSQSFQNSDNYFSTEYQKTAAWVYLLEATVGEGQIDKAFQYYFRLWKFKHPQPEDMKEAFEHSIHKSLNDYFGLLYKTGRLVK